MMQLGDSLHVTALHASLPVHETLHGSPAGQTISSHFCCSTQANVQTSFAQIPPAGAQRAGSHAGGGGVGVDESDDEGAGAGGGVELVPASGEAASGESTSSTFGLSIHA